MIIKLNKDEIKEVKNEIISDVVKSTIREEVNKEITKQFDDVTKDAILNRINQFENYQLKEMFVYELRNLVSNTFSKGKINYNSQLNDKTKNELMDIMFDKVLSKISIEEMKRMIKDEIKKKLLDL